MGTRTKGSVTATHAEAQAALNRQLSANARQVGGEHYKTEGDGEEHWDRVARLGLNYYEAAATKYIERARLKNGLEDIQKAIHYLEKLVELAEANKIEGY